MGISAWLWHIARAQLLARCLRNTQHMVVYLFNSLAEECLYYVWNCSRLKETEEAGQLSTGFFPRLQKNCYQGQYWYQWILI